MDVATFGSRLFSRRVQCRMTQADLAGAVDRTQTCVSYWENDRREPSLDDLAKLAKSLETSIDWLVLGDRNGILRGSRVAPRAATNDRGAGTEGDASMQGQAYTGAAGEGDA